jgi:hypothetical protein
MTNVKNFSKSRGIRSTSKGDIGDRDGKIVFLMMK